MKQPFWYLLLSSIVCPSTYASAEQSDAEKEIETLLVTSQRLERPWRELASNTNYVSKEEINRLALQDLDQLVTIVPNVSLTALAGDFNYIQMRGMPRNLEQATVGVYIDGIPYSDLYSLNPSLLNIESVEVIRGPQANLFGRNVRDGVIAITTLEPSEQTEGVVTLEFAGLNQNKFATNLSTSLGKNVRTQFSGSWLKRDGTVKNTTLSNELDPLEQLQLSNTWHWQASDKLAVKFVLNHTDKDSGAYPYVNGAKKIRDGDELTASNNVNNRFNQKTNNVTLKLDWNWSEDWIISAIANRVDSNIDARFDADFSAADLGFVDTWLDKDDSYYELRLSSQAYSEFSWLFGVSYSSNLDDNLTKTLSKVPVGKSIMEVEVDTAGKLKQKSYVAYADATWKLSDSWHVQGGLRWLKEKFNSTHSFTNPLFPIPSATTQGEQSVTDDKVLKKGAINYLIDSNHSLFVGYGEGYLRGGAAWVAEEITPQLVRQGVGVAYAPESSDTKELGYKYQNSQLGVFADITLFSSVLNNYQHSYADAFGLSHMASIEQVTSSGVEFNLRQQINDKWHWTLSYGVNNSEVDKIDTVTATSVGLKAGSRLPNTARNNGHLSINYSDDLVRAWLLDATLAVEHSGEVLFDALTDTKQKAYQVLNANVVLMHDSDWKVSIFANNLLDKRYQQYRVQYPGIDIANYGMPRQLGLAISKAF